MKKVMYLLALFAVMSCQTSNKPLIINQNEQSIKSNTNVLLIIADDLGIDAFPSYDIGDQKPKIPNIEKLVENGIRFTNCWAYPTCTPTRASIITGKHSFRTGMTQVGDELNTQELILQKLIDSKTDNRYSNAVIGKWHLSKDPSHPQKMGLDYYSGLVSGGVKDYSSWKHTKEGETNRINEYITSYFTNNAIEWIDEQEKPWFLWLAYTAPHTPFHLPPTNLHSYKDLPGTQNDIEANPQPYFFSMIEAMDTEIGRLLASIPKEELDNTVILFIGDNGTPNQVVQTFGEKKAKGSIYQGGINVPLVISGKNISRVNEVEDALVNSTDLFATIADITGTGITEFNDSKSLVPLFNNKNREHKSYLFSTLEKKKTAAKTIRNTTHKYIVYDSGAEELFDLVNDPFETQNLSKISSSENHMFELRSKLDELLNSESTESINTFSVTNGISCTEDLKANNNVSVTEVNGKRIITSNGIPNHEVGSFPNSGNPHTLSSQNILFEVTLKPKKANFLTSIYSESGFGIGRPSYEFGVVLNGIKLDPSAAEAFTKPGSKEKNFDWVKEALSSNNRLGDDCNNAHVQPNGEYHYHGTPWGFLQDANSKSMFLTGWAADGFPIYYKWGYKDPSDSTSNLVALLPSYKLRSGNRPGDGVTAPNGKYDGTYVRDFVYKKGLGDLDEANGRFGVTPEFPDGIYYYVITNDFPSIPRYFVGTPDKTFKIGGGKKQENSGHEHTHDSIQHNHEDSSNDKKVRFNKLDKNKDGKVDRSEAKGKFSERFDRLDKNKDGYVSKEEFIGKSN